MTDESNESETVNTINPDLIKKYFDLDDQSEAEILRLQMENMNAQCEVRDQQKRNFKMGVAEGLPKAAFKLELRRHRLDAKHKRQNDNLIAEEEADTVELADVIRETLGGFADTPLGAAAVESAEGKVAKRRAKKSEALDDLAGANDDDPRPDFLKRREAERIAENEALLTKGIKTLAN